MTNTKIPCAFCNKEIFYIRYLAHLLKHHLNDLFVGSGLSDKQTNVANDNYKKLKASQKDTDIPRIYNLTNGTDDSGTYCCFKCSTFVKNRDVFENKHFKKDTHIKENITAITELLQKVEKLRNTKSIAVGKPTIIYKESNIDIGIVEDILTEANESIRDGLINKKVSKTLYSSVIDLQTKLLQSEYKRTKMLELIRRNNLWTLEMEAEWNTEPINNIKQDLDDRITSYKEDLADTSTSMFWNGLEDEFKSIRMLKFLEKNLY